MAQSLAFLLVHIIFSTKDRAPVLDIDAQKEHHAKQEFQDEFRAFLRKYGVEFDERYLWD